MWNTAWPSIFSAVSSRLRRAKRLAVFLDERLFTPLKMVDSSFLASRAKMSRLAQPLPVDPASGQKVKRTRMWLRSRATIPAALEHFQPPLIICGSDRC